MAMYEYVPIVMLPAGPQPAFPGAPLQAFEQILGTRDCNPAIGELVLSADVARLFAPSGGDGPFDYNATINMDDGPHVVRVYKAAAGRETLLGEGWRDIVEEYDLMPSDLARFEKSLQENATFTALFQDPDGLNRLSRTLVGDPPSPPEFQEYADLQWLPVHPMAGRGEQAAGADGGVRAFQGDTMTIEEAMDLAVESGAQEGSDELYMATKLFVKAKNRAMFGTFRTNAGRLQWLRRCYEDRMN